MDPFYTKWRTAGDVIDKVQVSGRNRTAIVTGSNSGIGYQTALALCRTGFHVICCCRSKEKSLSTVQKIQSTIQKQQNEANEASNTGVCTTGVVDLGDLDSVRDFVTSLNTRPINILVNNAGIMQLPNFSPSKQGYEMQFHVNFLGPWLLTELLKPNLKLAATNDPTNTLSRVVNVASSAHYSCTFSKIPDITQIGNPEKAKNNYTDGWNEYATSKMYQILHARSIAAKHNDKIVAFSLHPGVIATKLSRNAKCCTFTRLLYCWPKSLYCCCFCCCPGCLRTNVEQGAASSVRACIDPALVDYSGSYLGEDTQVKEPRLPPSFDFDGLEVRLYELCGLEKSTCSATTATGAEKKESM